MANHSAKHHGLTQSDVMTKVRAGDWALFDISVPHREAGFNGQDPWQHYLQQNDIGDSAPLAMFVTRKRRPWLLCPSEPALASHAVLAAERKHVSGFVSWLTSTLLTDSVRGLAWELGVVTEELPDMFSMPSTAVQILEVYGPTRSVCVQFERGRLCTAPALLRIGPASPKAARLAIALRNYAEPMRDKVLSDEVKRAALPTNAEVVAEVCGRAVEERKRNGYSEDALRAWATFNPSS